MRNSSGPLRIFLWIALLAIGFFVGIAWKTSETPTDSTTFGEEEYHENQQLQSGTEASPTPVKNRTADTKNDLTATEKANIALFEEAAPSVCFITTSNVRMDYFTRDVTEIPRGSGSGFVWDKSGHIVTNFHVIQGADKAQITLADQSTWEAELVGIAPDKDLAVLRIDVPTSKLRPIPLGISEDLRVGQSVYAIGNPFGLDQTLTTGIVSALGREIESVSGIPIRDVVQTDAAINPGNSGGPLLNSSGRLIGVNTAIYSPSGASAGIGFSIPVDVVSWVVPELIRFGELKRPTLGIESASPQIAKRFNIEGVLVVRVFKGSAAERAGLKSLYQDRRGNLRADIIVGLNGEVIKSRNDLVLALEKYKPGDRIKLKIRRDEEIVALDVTLDAPQ